MPNQASFMFQPCRYLTNLGQINWKEAIMKGIYCFDGILSETKKFILSNSVLLALLETE